MTESEASTILKAEIVHHPECSIFAEALGLAIQALEAVQQCQKIGTVEECQEASSKQLPKKFKEDGYFGSLTMPVLHADMVQEVEEPSIAITAGRN